MTDSDDEQETVAVRTYVPEYQREIWKERADDLGMSLSEFVRTMTQAGSRGFEPPDPPKRTTSVEQSVLEVLDNGPRTFGELADEIVGGVESQIDETLQDLVQRGQVTFSGRGGRYELTE